jgi:hypothetical protein
MTVISRQAGILLADGSIVGKDGISNLEFYNTIKHELFIVVQHRNHLSVLSAFPAIAVSQYLSYDFTVSAEQVYNSSSGYVELTSGIWGMVAGDANQDKQINDLDMTTYWESQVGLKGYLSTDYNLDNQANNMDKNDLWIKNRGKSSQVP